MGAHKIRQLDGMAELDKGRRSPRILYSYTPFVPSLGESRDCDSCEGRLKVDSKMHISEESLVSCVIDIQRCALCAIAGLVPTRVVRLLETTVRREGGVALVALVRLLACVDAPLRCVEEKTYN